MKRIIRLLRPMIFTVVSLNAMFCNAKEKSDDEESYKWEGNLTGDLNTNGWGLSVGFNWMPFTYVGIGASIGFDSEIVEISDWGRDYSDPNYINDYCARFIFKPSLLFRTPSLLNVKSQDLSLHLFASPGVIMSPYPSGSKNSGWLYWTGSTGITAILDRLVFSLGYSCSDYSLIDGNPRTHHSYGYVHKTNDYVHKANDYGTGKKHLTHSVFLSFGFKF